jgi:hypothetical protein
MLKKSICGWIAFGVLIMAAQTAYAKGSHSYSSHRVKYSGSHHTTSHGGHYSGGHGSSHKGGSYRNTRTSNHYGRHK